MNLRILVGASFKGISWPKIIVSKMIYPMSEMKTQSIDPTIFLKSATERSPKIKPFICSERSQIYAIISNHIEYKL